MARRAFTLIELLVVIAIIAILAAILFPVFAQAKLAAKKSVHVSNYKQTGTACQIYLSDSDDVYPQAMVRRPVVGTWGYGVVMPVPANAVSTAPWTDPARIAMAQCFWGNSLQPYMKNLSIFEMNAAKTTTQVAGEVFTAGVTPAKMGLNMNGYLHNYPSTAIENASVVPLFWNVQSVNFLGRGMSTPIPLCQGTDDNCRFNPSGRPDSNPSSSNGGYYVYDFTNSSWQYDKKGVIVRADTSTKVVANGTAVDPAYVGWSGKLNDPWAAVDANGVAISLWDCDGTYNGQDPAAGDAWCFFRPDRKE